MASSGVPAATMASPRPLGRVRPVGTLILLCIVTLGIYSYFWAYSVHEELRQYVGRGMGGVVGLVLWFFLAPVVAFTLPNEIDQDAASFNENAGVSAITGLWILLPIVGSIVWFVKVQSALNRFWAGRGAPQPARA